MSDSNYQDLDYSTDDDEELTQLKLELRKARNYIAKLETELREFYDADKTNDVSILKSIIGDLAREKKIMAIEEDRLISENARLKAELKTLARNKVAIDNLNKEFDTLNDKFKTIETNHTNEYIELFSKIQNIYKESLKPIEEVRSDLGRLIHLVEKQYF